jgi:hypothetical protein
MRKVILSLSALTLVAGSMPAFAAPCRDAKGKFVKCPRAKVKVRCRDAKGQYAKCETKGAKPA